MDLGYFGRGLLGSCPQADAGVVLWSLSVCASDWQSARETDAPLHHSRTGDVFRQLGQNALRDRGQNPPTAPLVRIIEHRSEKIPSSRFGEHHFYRKTELFDRLLAFDIQVDLLEGARH